MENLIIKATVKTPKIDLNLNGQWVISGSSYPENVSDFYRPVIGWIEDFLDKESAPVQLNIDLKYINTSSIKLVLTIITMVSSRSKNEVKVNWMYEIEDEDMMEIGAELEQLSKVKFDFVSKN